MGDMKNNAVNIMVDFFKGLAEMFLYYAVPFVAFFAETLLLGFLLDVFNASLCHSYVWLTVIVTVAILLMPKLFYKTFLKMWDGAKRSWTIMFLQKPSEVEETKYAYLFALMPALILDWGMTITFYDDLVNFRMTGGDIPKLVTSALGFMIGTGLFFRLLIFADKQFKQLFRKCKND
ncbi:MAG: hypothetical protein JHC26_04895 [Thermofilum sp.]|uniref:hypothetical protein n=1 Tax=Thermofilum sp. TaxID=1961369 RepID=UPI00258CC103|nr:hypothetical protein [Thermofilum sp.]MCI4408406.1 hypothetical protein [Thermofilum sp.]